MFLLMCLSDDVALMSLYLLYYCIYIFYIF